MPTQAHLPTCGWPSGETSAAAARSRPHCSPAAALAPLLLLLLLLLLPLLLIGLMALLPRQYFGLL
jgi:hypothetical protein